MDKNKYVFRLAGISLLFPIIPLLICPLFGSTGSEDKFFQFLCFTCVIGLLSIPMAFFQVFLLGKDIDLTRAKKLIVFPLGWSMIISAVCILAVALNYPSDLSPRQNASLALWTVYLASCFLLIKYFIRKICTDK